MRKLRVTFEIDITDQYVNDYPNRWPITAENGLEWYETTFDAHPGNYTLGFITNSKAEIIED